MLLTGSAMFAEELLNLHRGQGLDLFWRDSLTCPTEEEYIHMVLGSTPIAISGIDANALTDTLIETGGLFRIAVKLMMANSESEVYASCMKGVTNEMQGLCSACQPHIGLFSNSG